MCKLINLFIHICTNTLERVFLNRPARDNRRERSVIMDDLPSYDEMVF